MKPANSSVNSLLVPSPWRGHPARVPARCCTALLALLASLPLGAATVTWTGASGDWGAPANWSTGASPGPSDDVMIPAGPSVTVTHSTGSDTVNSVVSYQQLTLSGGSLAISSTLQIDNSLNLSGGVLIGAIVQANNGGSVIVGAQGGTLDGVTLDCDLNLAINGIMVDIVNLYIVNGLTLNGATVYLGNAAGSTAGQMLFDNTGTLGGTGTVLLGKNGGNGIYTGSTLTIGSGITVRGSSGTLGGEWSGSIVNQGTIAADDSGGLSGDFVYDTGYSGDYSQTGSTADWIDLSGVSDPAPQAVYQTWRYAGYWPSPFSYALGSLTTGAVYAVRLHFAEPSYSAVGWRQFNVSINGTQVLTNFDIVAAAGGKDKAVVETFPATADGNGQVTVSFRQGAADSPLVNGIEVLSGGTVVEAINCGLVAGGTIRIDPNTLPTQGTLTFTNQGTLSVSNGEALNISGLSGNLGVATLSGAGSSLTLNGSSYVIDQGLSAPAGTTLTLNGTWRSASTITAANATLSLGDGVNAWTNAGTILATNSTVNLGGPLTWATLGLFQPTGGTVNLTGLLDNTGQTLALDATTGSWMLRSGSTISNGTVTATGGAQLIAAGGKLNGVTLGCDLNVTDNNNLHIVNGLTLNGATVYLGNAAGSTAGQMYFDDTETLGGTGTVLLGKNGGNGIYTYSGQDPTLTIGPGITVRGSSGTLGDGWGSGTSSIVNQGTIAADDSGGLSGDFVYDTGYSGYTGWTANTSDWIDVSGVSDPAPQAVYQTCRSGGYSGDPLCYVLGNLIGGASYTVRLHFADAWDSNVGQRQFDLSVNGTQVLTNFDIVAAAGGKDKAVVETFPATADGNGQITVSFWQGAADLPLVNGIEVLSGGTVVEAINCGLVAGGTITISPSTFTNQGTLSVSSGEALNISGLTRNLGVATLGGAGSSLTLDGSNYVIGQALSASAGTTLTLNGTWSNASTITASNATLSLGDGVNAWTNAGTILATNSTVNLGGSLTWATLGLFQPTGGTVNLTGVLDNTGQTLALDATTGSWMLGSGSTISNGTVTATGGAQLIPAGGTLNGVTLACDLNVADYNNVHIVNGLTLNGVTVYLGNAAGSTAGQMYFDNTETLGGTGTVLLGKNGGNGIYTYNPYSWQGPTLTIGSGITVRGSSGTLGNGWGSGTSSIVNQGTIAADDTGGLSGDFVYDKGYSGDESWTDSTADPINISAVSDPAPQAVYETWRYDVFSPFSYALGSFTAGAGYTVRLHFAEPSYSAVGQRQFNVSINGTQVLTNFDIVAAAGGMDKAVVETFPATADGDGQITVGFWQGAADSPLVNGIEVLSGGTVVEAINCGLLAGGTITVNAGGFTNQGTLSAASGEALGISNLGGSLGIAALAGAGSSLTISGLVNLGTNDILDTQSGTTLSVSGDLLSAAALPVQYTPRGTVILDGQGTAGLPQLLGAMSADRGNTPAAFENNFGYGVLDIANNTYVQLTNQVQNQSGVGIKAVYVNSLIIEPGATLDLNGLSLYARAAQLGGTVMGGTVSQAPASGPIALGTPTPGAISTAGELAEWTLFGRGGESVTVIVNSGSGGAPPPASPTLDWAQVQILDSAGNALSTATNATAGQVVALTIVSLPADGTYRVQVRASASNAASTGNYMITVWNVSPSVSQIQLGQQASGRIATPYSVQRWTFSAVAGQQIRFNLLNSSDAGVVFDLQGPAGWLGFTDLAASSPLITLPASGGYTLTAHGTGGQYGEDFSFVLQPTAQTGLAVNTTYTGTLAGSGDAQLLELTVTNGSPLLIQLANAGAGNYNEIYAKLGAPPTRSDYDYKFSSPASANQRILVPSAAAGTWYVLVYDDYVPTPGAYTLSVTAADVFLFSSAPQVSGTIADTLLGLTGAGFDSGVTVQLAGTNGTNYAAARVNVVSGEQLTAQFPAGSVPAGTYSIVATASSGALAELTNAFTMLEGGLPHLTTSVIVPSVIGYHMPSTIYVEYANTGTAAMPAPLLRLTATQNGLQGAFLTLDQSRADESFWTDTMPPGYSTSVAFLASGAGAGLLQPGESSRVPVHYAGWLHTQWDFSRPPIYFTVGVLTADDATPIDWNAFAQQVRPSGMDDATWAADLANLQTQLGPTWGGYVVALDNDATRLSQRGQLAYTIPSLFALNLLRAGQSPIAGISGRVVDASSGAAVGGVVVYDHAADFTSAATTTTDATGAFTLAGLSDGVHNLSLGGYFIDSNPTVTITNQLDVLGVQLKATAAAHISGHVKAASDGRILTNVVVLCIGETNSQTFQALSDAAGYYSFSTLPADSYALTCSPTGFVSGSIIGIVVALGQTRSATDFNLVAGLTISGTVQMQSEGTPVRGATVQLQSQTTGASITTTTDAGGHYQFTALSAGTYNLAFTLNGQPGQGVSGIQISTGQTLSSETLTVSGVTASGTVISGVAGTNIPSAQLLLYSNQVAVSAAITDTNGLYALQGIPPGTYSLSASAPGYAPTNVPSIPIGGSSTQFDLTLGAPADIVGKITLGGQAASNVFVVATLEGDPIVTPSSATSADDGTFDVQDLAPGTYDLSIIAPGSSPALQTNGVPVASGDKVDLGTLALAQGPGLAIVGGRGARQGSSPRTFDLIAGWTPPLSLTYQGWTPPGHPPVPSNSSDPVVIKKLADSYTFLELVWVRVLAPLWFGSQDAQMYNQFLHSTRETPTPMQAFSDGSQIVEGSLLAPGFRDSLTTAANMSAITNLATSHVLNDYLDAATQDPSFSVQLDIMDVLWDQPSLLYVRNDPKAWNFDYPAEIPGNIAGGCGPSADEYPDGRWVTGTVFVQRAGNELDLTDNLTLYVLDNLTFYRGNPGTSREQKFTGPLSLLELYDMAYDVPYTVTCNMEPVTLTVPLPQPPNPPEPPNPPYNDGGDGSTTGVTSQDPNEKIGPAGFGAAGYVAAGSLLPYRIDFENSTNATAPAQQVIVTDQLSTNLESSTFQLTEIGFGSTVLAPPQGIQSYATNVPITYNGVSFEVQVSVDLDFASGLMTAEFNSINPATYLPPSVLVGFLPPEDGTGRGQGHVSYTIQAKTGLPTGTQILNVADIVFDQGEVIATDQVNDEDPTQGIDPSKITLNTIDAVAPTSGVQPLPTQSSNTFQVQWSGQDDPGGSGVASYSIYVSANGGPWTAWLSGTTATNASFTGQAGGTYGFYSVATDNVGNQEATHATADATTRVVPGLSTVSLGGNVWYYPTNYPATQPSGNGVGGVSVSLSGGLDTNALSGSDGSYSFPGLGVGLNYEVSLVKSDDTPVANGVTTLDIALIRRHILALALLDSPYKLLAADVNDSGTITTLDIALIRRLILGLTNTYPIGLWRFVPADYVFPDPLKPWDAPTNRWYTNLVTDMAGQDYVAIKLGDVNNSWVGPAETKAEIGKAESRNLAPDLPGVRFEAGSQVAQRGERVAVPVRASGSRQATSAQFSLGWDARVLRYEGVGEFGVRGLGEENFGTGLADRGKLAFSWDDPAGTGLEVAEGTALFTVYFDVIGAPGSVSPVTFSDSPTVREATADLVPRAFASGDGRVMVVGERPVISCGGDASRGTFRISVPSVRGRRYLLESADSLSGANWRAVEAVVGDGSVRILRDSAATTQQRFYRVRVE